jgi:hypothetical protein
MDTGSTTLGAWLLISATVLIIALCVEDSWHKAVLIWLGALFLPILLPLGIAYLAVTLMTNKTDV